MEIRGGRVLRSVLVLLLAGVIAPAVSSRTVEATTPPTWNIVVNSTADGVCGLYGGLEKTLRCAISEASTYPSAVITFNVAGVDCASTEPVVLYPATPLPPLTANSTQIDGYSECGSKENSNTTLDAGSNAVIRIQIDGARVAPQSSSPGLQIQGANDTVDGLSITGFSAEGLVLSPSTANTMAPVGDQVWGNFIGLAPDGKTAEPNGVGIRLVGGRQDSATASAPQDRTIIGGTMAGSPNVISGNRGDGITVVSGANDVINANFVGTSAAPEYPVPNGGAGLNFMRDDPTVPAVGEAVTNNVIANNARGIAVGGGPGAGPGNGDATLRVAISRNSIHDNGGFGSPGLGIDLAPLGAPNCGVASSTNGGVSCPVITAASDIAGFSGTACPGCLVELFAATNEPDDTFGGRVYGEGTRFVTSAMADKNGAWLVPPQLGGPGVTPPYYLTATATSGPGTPLAATSEFAANVLYNAPEILDMTPRQVTSGRATDLPITVTGFNVGDTSVIVANGTALGTTYRAPDHLSATVPAALLAQRGTVRISVHSSGAFDSTPQPLYVTDAAVGVVVDSATSQSDVATATTGGTGLGTPGSLVATALGSSGTVTVAQYSDNPTTAPPPPVTGGSGFFDVHLSSPNTFSAATVTDCDLPGPNRSLYWYNGAGWVPVQGTPPGQVYDAARHCTSAIITASTSPTLNQLTGTPFMSGPGSPTAAPVSDPRVVRRGSSLIFHWRLVNRSGVNGFLLYAGKHRLSPVLIPVHARAMYRARVKWSAGPYWLKVVLPSGNIVIPMR
ncbi:MAG: hypothetical protein M3Z66_21985 [Chloroflexota bacterium]|nr:hypothetical protein [Chloroflexota bacterium]